jgi:two-component system cell cycle response regulator
MNAGNDDDPTSRPSRPPEAARTVRFGGMAGGDAEAGPRQAFLTVIRSKGDLSKHVAVERPLVIGRDPDCDFHLQDLGVSWHHARITPQGDCDFVLEDLHSTNGTRVNGVAVASPRLLQDGEKIFTGETVMRFSLADAIDIHFQSEIATLVGTDPLTGLESKRNYDEALEFALLSAQESGGTLAMLMMDMDGVKQINDTHGHLFGAHVIGETGRIIARHVGPGGHACRFGGDEFSAFLPGQTGERGMAVAEAIRVAVENAGMEKDGIPLKPTISIGVASYPESGDKVLELIHASDSALYRAKGDGKNCVRQ